MPERAAIDLRKLFVPDPIKVRVSKTLTDYTDAVSQMEQTAELIATGQAPETLWLLEHPSIYTAGTSAKARDLLTPGRFPVYATGRGGQYTYHGPGQRVAYVMLDIRKRGQDVRAFVAGLEHVIIEALRSFGIKSETREDRVGIWVCHDAGEDKIAAIGIRIRKGISFHGLAVNIAPDLSHFEGIVPCGVTAQGVTSMIKLGYAVAMADFDNALVTAFSRTFGPIVK